jgi:hypothetical protein
VPSRPVYIPRHLLHVSLDDLPRLGVGQSSCAALRELLADLPLVPGAGSSAQLVGPPAVALPCLAVLARHVGQGLRDSNLAMAHDRRRLHAERRKLLFLSAQALADALAQGDGVGARPPGQPRGAGLVSFVTTLWPMPELAHWRQVHLGD